MGYSYGQTDAGRWALSCDSCGKAEGTTRKRTCPRKVLGDSTRSTTRHEMRYCYPPALCGECFAREGRTAGIHGTCAEGAAKSQARYDEIERRYQTGEGYVISASGDWADDVPAGMVKVTFAFPPSGSNGWREYLVPAADYDSGEKHWLTDYPSASPVEVVTA